MVATHRVLGRAALFGTVVAALLGSAQSASAAPCSEAAANKCTVGVGELKAQLTTGSNEVIDSGWMESGSIKVRAKFTLAPVGREPLVNVALPATALVEATWTEKGYLDLKPLDGATGKMDVRYTLVPAIEASVYGISITKNAQELINSNISGASFNYDVKASGTVPSWGFGPGQVKPPSPALDQSTIYSTSFSNLGIDSGTITGTFALQAATSPTFTFQAKEVSFGPASSTAKGAAARIAISDQDSVDVSATIRGEVSYAGTLDVRPRVTADTVYGYDTYGLTNFSFSAASKPYEGKPMAVSSNTVTLHIALPNVKVPTAGVSLGDVKSGGKAEKTISIENTGELEAVYTVQSSDPAFTVPSGQLKIAPKSKGDLKLAFTSGGGAASTTITIKSNDPDSPEQTFKVGANGADVAPDETSTDGSATSRKSSGVDSSVSDASGCAVAAPGGANKAGNGARGFEALGLGLGLAAVLRLVRRR
jgi:hypothetical protein